MKRLLLASLSLPLVACYAGERRASGECPAGETCSDVTPTGLAFVGNALAGSILWSGPRATAIGGTQTVALEYDRGDGLDVALDMPYIADDDGGNGVKVESTSGSQVTIRGTASRTNYLRILDTDGLLMDRKQLSGAALDRMELVSVDFESIPENRDVAFNVGQRDIGIALYGDVQNGNSPVSERIIDTSMQLTLTGSTRRAWDMLGIDLPVGAYSLGVTAGDKPTNNLEVVVVDHADSIAAFANQPTTIQPNISRNVCFEALAGTRYVVGLAWTFDVDGEVETHEDGDLMRNCVSVSTTKLSGTVAISASAGGQSTSLSLTVAQAREQLGAMPRVKELPVAIPTAGDRAAL